MGERRAKFPQIGSGGFGDVWKATWNGRGGGIVVAVKKIRVSIINEKIKNEIFEEVNIHT
jgi:hypothetical protein